MELHRPRGISLNGENNEIALFKSTSALYFLAAFEKGRLEKKEKVQGDRPVKTRGIRISALFYNSRRNYHFSLARRICDSTRMEFRLCVSYNNYDYYFRRLY